MPASTPTTAHPLQEQPQLVSARLVSVVVSGLLVAAPVVVFALVWHYYAVNVPKWDDHALRAYLYFSDQEKTISGKIYQLFRQLNEPRIVYDRLIATLDYRLFGKLSYVHMMVVGNMSLVGLLALFGAVLHRAQKPLLYTVPVALLLFNLSHWENMFWGMAALQNFSVVFWVVLAIYLLCYSKRWELAVASAILATLTSGNGILVWPIGFVLLLLQTPFTNQQRNAGAANRPTWLHLGWIVVAVIVITLYFIGFEKPAGNPPNRGSLTDLLKGWLAFMGAAAEALSTGSPLSASTRLGGLMALATLGFLGWSLRLYGSIISYAIQHIFNLRRWYAPAAKSGTINSVAAKASIPPIVLFFWGTAAFILGTAAVVAWTRMGFGMHLLITSRYKIYSLTLLALLYVYAVARMPMRAQGWIAGISTLGSLLIAWLSYNAYLGETIWWRHWMLTSQQFNATHGTNSPVSQVDAVTEKYTNPAPAFYDSNPGILYRATPSPTVPVTVTVLPTGFEIQQPTLTLQDQRDSRSYVVVRSPKRTYLFPTRQNQILTLRTRFWPASPFKAGFTATIPSTDLDAGLYNLFILTLSTNGLLTLYPTGQSITSAGQSAVPLQKNW